MKWDFNSRSTKKTGTNGRMLFKPYINLNVIVSSFFYDDQMPAWALEEQEFFAKDLIWLRKADGTKWTKLDGNSITRYDKHECAFHHRWFTKVDDWDKETN